MVKPSSGEILIVWNISVTNAAPLEQLCSSPTHDSRRMLSFVNHVRGLVSMNQKLLTVYRTGSQRAGGRVSGWSAGALCANDL